MNNIATAAQRYAEGLQSHFDAEDAEKYPALCVDGPYRVFSVNKGRRFDKIVQTQSGQRSVHAFVEVETGHVYKAEGWAKPAKGVRFATVEDALEAAKSNRYGYLYR